MPWIIVKFSGSEEIEAVPSCWYDDSRGTLLYPPLPRNRMEKAIRNETQPGDDWREYSVSLMRDKHYDNFRMACGKASKCCITSEVSETEVISEKRVSKKKFSTSEEDSGSDLEIPRPQAIKKRITPQLTAAAVEQATNIATTTQTGKAMSEKEIEEIEKVTEAIDETKFKRTCISMMVKTIKLLRECDTKISELSEKVEEISLSLNDKRLPPEDNLANVNDCLDLFKDFPIKNELMLENVENKLADEKIYKKLVDNLCMIGGRDYKDCSRRFLQKIICDRFAAEYSLHGHKKKKVFKSTRICACLLDAIQRCHHNKASLKDIEMVVSVYLAKATERLKRNEVVNNYSATGIDVE